MTENQQKIVAKALKEPAFKAELLKNPNAAIEKALGIKIPAGVTIKVVEDTAAAVNLVLPAPAKAEKGALSEGDLSKVSGGAGSQKSTYFPCDSSNYNPRCIG